MKRLPFLTALLPACLLALSAPAEARPVSATLFPGGALVTEEDSLLPEGGRIAFVFPAGADADSLTVSLSRGVETGRRLSLLKGEAAPAVAALQQEADALRGENALREAGLSGIGAMRQFWSQPPYLLDGGNAKALEGRMGRSAEETAERLASLAKEEAALVADLRQDQRRLSALEARIRELGVQNADTRQCLLDIRDSGDGHVTVRWTYWLEGAGWRPQYRVDADSAKGRVTVRMDAAVTQHSGMDWEGVDVTLSSANELHQVSPPALRDWTLGETGRPAFARKNMVAMAAVPAIPSSQQAGSLHWPLGEMDVPAGSAVSRLVAEYGFDAPIRRLLRPAQDSRAWLEAALGPDPKPVLPAGHAVFTTDGTQTARGHFQLAPQDRSIPLGIDQFVNVEVREMAGGPEQGKAGILRWDRTFTITSGHDEAVAVRVEEAVPVARDARIRIDVRTEPQATFGEGRSRMFWEMDLPARGSLALHSLVRAEMPEKADERP